MGNPYFSENIIPDIAKEWQNAGYGDYTNLKDGTYLLYHQAVRSYAEGTRYHIHIGADPSVNLGWASVKADKQHPYRWEGLNSGDYTAKQWTDFLWDKSGYSRWLPKKGGGKRSTRKHKKTIKRSKTIKLSKTIKRRKTNKRRSKKL
jgi:hypothetical protein